MLSAPRMRITLFCIQVPRRFLPVLSVRLRWVLMGMCSRWLCIRCNRFNGKVRERPRQTELTVAFQTPWRVLVSERPCVGGCLRGFSDTFRMAFQTPPNGLNGFSTWPFTHPRICYGLHAPFPALIYPLVFRWNFNHSTRLSTFPQAERRTFRGLTSTFSGVSNTMTVMNHAGRGLSNTISMDYRTPFYGVSDTFPWTNRHLAW